MSAFDRGKTLDFVRGIPPQAIRGNPCRRTSDAKPPRAATSSNPQVARHTNQDAKTAGRWALQMSRLSLMAGDWPWGSGGKRAGSENGLAIIASRSNGGGVMIGSEAAGAGAGSWGFKGGAASPLSVRHVQHRVCGSPRARITAGSHVKSTGTARSAFPAVGLDLAGPYRETGKTGLEWRDSRARVDFLAEGLGTPPHAR